MVWKHINYTCTVDKLTKTFEYTADRVVNINSW